MSCAIMRKNLTIPPVEALKRAFRSVKCLTEYDAVILANDASGILVNPVPRRSQSRGRIGQLRAAGAGPGDLRAACHSQSRRAIPDPGRQGGFRLSKPECLSRRDHLAALAPGPERRRLNNAYRWSKGAGSQAHWFFERCFPLTPSLPEERENRTPRFQPSGAPRLVAARDALFPLPAGEGQGEGEGGLQLSATRRLAWRGALFSLAQNSQLHRQFASALVCGAFLPPHPGPLPEERENRTLRFSPIQSASTRRCAGCGILSPLF